MRLELFRNTSKIIALARSGYITYARNLFDGMSQRDTVTWNAMLSSYSQLGHKYEALSLFRYMRICDTRPDNFTLTAALSACAGLNELQYGTKIHALAIVLGYQSSLPVNNSIIDMYGKCLNSYSARRVFEEMNIRNEATWCSLLYAHTKSSEFDLAYEVFSMMPIRVEIAWNIMIAGFARCGEVRSCLALFKDMLQSLCCPDQWTLSAIMNACAESSELFYGCMIHALIIKSGWSSAVEAMNSLLSYYAEVGCHGDAVKVFESIGALNQVSWNAMIDANMKLGDTEKACIAFQQAPERNIVSWTSMISGYARNGHGEQAISFFVNMIRNGLQPDDITFGALLHACSNLAVLGLGKMVHGCVVYYGFDAYAYVGNGLINMYAKCGDLEGSICTFNNIHDKDLVSWNAMLFGFGLNGRASRAIKLYEEMIASGVKPDKVTFIGLLMTCSHSGLIEESRELCKTMRSDYGLYPEMDHVACMVDMLGRGGYLAEAKELASKCLGMNGATTSSWEALLGACSAHQDVELGTNMGTTLKNLEPHKDLSYVLLSNLYCVSGQWKEAEIIRKAMVHQGVKKMPGCSWIEVKNKVTVFVAGTSSYPFMDELHNLFGSLEFEMKNPCFLGVES